MTECNVAFRRPFVHAQYLQRVEPDGSHLTQITHPAANEKDEVADSITDKFIVFQRYDSTTQDRDLWVKYIWDSRPEVRLTNTRDRSEGLPVVSHSGKLLAYRVFLGGGQDDHVHVARFDSETSITVLHTIDLQSPADVNISGIDFAGDDKTLFVTTQAQDVPGGLVNRKQEVFKVQLDGSGQVRLTNDTAEDVCPTVVS